MSAIKPRHVQFCPPRCPNAIVKGKTTDRCRKGFWRNSDAFKAPVYYGEYKLMPGAQMVLVQLVVVQPADCAYKRGAR